MARTLTRTRKRNGRWEQDTEGNAAIFDAVFYDNVMGLKVATWKLPVSGGGNMGHGFENRYIWSSRQLMKTGGLVLLGMSIEREWVGGWAKRWKGVCWSGG